MHLRTVQDVLVYIVGSVLDQDLDWEFGSEWGILIRILEARKTHVLKCCLWWAGGF
jgi:hypothetical protein